jgi:ribosome-associated heat shock protein Hsp15
MATIAAQTTRLRLDKWLWFARFCKTRAIAQKLIESGHVAVNGTKIRKVSALVRMGDVLVLVLGPVKKTVTIRAMAERRGPASVAQTLYEELAPAEQLVGLDKGIPLHKQAIIRPRGAGRPTKKDRRSIEKYLAEQ